VAEDEEGPRTVHLDPSQLPGGARFRAPVIPKVEPGSSGMETQISQVPDEIAGYLAAAAPPQTGDPTATEPLGPRPPVIRRPGPDRTAVYSSTPRSPAGTASVPGSPPNGAAQAGPASRPVSGPPQGRAAWTVEPSWSAYPARPSSEGANNGSPSPRAPERAATGPGKPQKPAKKQDGRRTVLILVVVVLVASLIGAGLALVFGDRLIDLVNNFTGS
jgi:hypothetical protein